MEGKYALLFLIPAIFMIALAIGDHLVGIYSRKAKNPRLFGLPIYNEEDEDEEWEEIEDEE